MDEVSFSLITFNLPTLLLCKTIYQILFFGLFTHHFKILSYMGKWCVEYQDFKIISKALQFYLVPIGKIEMILTYNLFALKWACLDLKSSYVDMLPVWMFKVKLGRNIPLDRGRPALLRSQTLIFYPRPLDYDIPKQIKNKHFPNRQRTKFDRKGWFLTVMS